MSDIEDIEELIKMPDIKPDEPEPDEADEPEPEQKEQKQEPEEPKKKKERKPRVLTSTTFYKCECQATLRCSNAHRHLSSKAHLKGMEGRKQTDELLTNIQNRDNKIMDLERQLEELRNLKPAQLKELKPEQVKETSPVGLISKKEFYKSRMRV